MINYCRIDFSLDHAGRFHERKWRLHYSISPVPMLIKALDFLPEETRFLTCSSLHSCVCEVFDMTGIKARMAWKNDARYSFNIILFHRISLPPAQSRLSVNKILSRGARASLLVAEGLLSSWGSVSTLGMLVSISECVSVSFPLSVQMMRTYQSLSGKLSLTKRDLPSRMTAMAFGLIIWTIKKL